MKSSEDKQEKEMAKQQLGWVSVGDRHELMFAPLGQAVFNQEECLRPLSH